MRSCPACSRPSAGDGRFCPWCAAPLDATSAETAVLAAAAPPDLSSTSQVDEGRFLPGTVLAGRYRVAGLLGRGGMGEVYRATDLTLGQAVALKFLPEGASRDERALARFYNEVRIARQVTHPNVCRVYDIGAVEGLHYISMEFVDGEDLGILLRRIGRLPVDKAVETARKLCAGLAAAHEKGVLHRDLKPANIMIDGRGQVIIMDFGLAGWSEQLQGDVRSGTPAYMSPEQLAGTEVTARSDIYALGLVMYELFTGKRAFEAASLMELMEMQERASPLSISTVVKDLDPAVERVILRCLERDPRKRPATALAVAAGLPGGDPLAAALAAGETPSPDLLAAAGETEGLRPPVALAWLAAVLAGIVMVAVLGAKLSLTDAVLEVPPEGLARDARLLLQSFGYTARPGDRAWGFEYPQESLDYLRSHSDVAAARWKNPALGLPPVIAFWYRESPRDLAAIRGLSVFPSFSDPPMEVSGMVRLRMDPQGKLRELQAIPLQVEAPAPPAQPFDWAALYRAAGLDLARFQPAEPQWTPPASWDARAAWTGADPQGGGAVRVEAAAWRGRPVFFRIIGPWTKPEQGGDRQQGGIRQVLIAVVYFSLISACLIAWHNTRTGKGDRRGAMRLFLLYFLCVLAGRFLAMHHTATMQELGLFWAVVASASINGGLAAVFYLALEPWVRRRWPQTLISWSRYISKGVRDPLVGRDVLYGSALGVAWAVLNLIQFALHGRGSEPLLPEIQFLSGTRMAVNGILDAFAGALISALLFFFLLFIVRVVLRKPWIATAAFIAILTVFFSAGTTYPWIDWPTNVVFAAIFAVLLLRFGLLALIAAQAVTQTLVASPLTLEFSAWYAGVALAALAVVALIAFYGFRTSLAGRPLLKQDLL